MTTPRHRDLLRALPAVDRLAEAAAALDAAPPAALIRDAARRVLDRARGRLLAGAASEVDPAALAEECLAAARALAAPALPRVVNATGIVVHTGLGRAPLAAEALHALLEAAAGAAPVELDVATGERGRRAALVEPLLAELTGAEAATVVNNNAAATLVALAALAGDGREVLVARGELVEIGGSFRVPEVVEAGGARLREVGTTNRTRVADYERAIGERTGAILKVHPSNYRVRGFTEETTIAELVALGRHHDLPVVHDVGSGAIAELAALGLGDEPLVPASVAAGADLVLFSGDKLIGGPQAGVIVGRRTAVRRVEAHPLMRAVRPGKLTLAALAATLQLHRDPALARDRVPVLRMLAESEASVAARAERVCAALAAPAGWTIEVVAHDAYAGGGSMPELARPSRALRVARRRGGGEAALGRALRERGIVARVAEGAVLLDLRSVAEEEEPRLAAGLAAALASVAERSD